MKISTLHWALRICAIVLGISVASQASAKYFHNPATSSHFRTVKVEYTPTIDLSVFGTFNNSGSGFMGMLRVPVSPIAPVILRDGGHEGDHGDDTTGGGDTTDDNGGPHDGDNDTSDGNFGDTTNCGGDSTGHHHDHGDFGEGNDTTRGNDTVDCGHHHADNDDSTNVNDTNSHALFNGGRQSIYIKSNSSQANVTFTFTNNLKSSVTLSSIALASGKNFTITSAVPTRNRPSKVAAGASIVLKIAFKVTDNGIHTDQLVVQSSGLQTANQIVITGQKVASASVANSLPACVTITMAPNPMTSSMKVNLNGVTSASAVIFDLNGKQVISTPINSSEWVWNGTAKDGTTLLSGTYIVRLSGLSADGSPFVSTQKIVLQH